MKKLISALFAALLILTSAFPALAAGSYDYVNDETGSLSQDTVNEIAELNAVLEERYEAQFIVVFVDYFGDAYADEYAVDLFNEWQLPNKAMLLVVSPKEGRGGMTVGADIVDRFTEDDINAYLDEYFWDDFDNGRYDKAVTTLADKIGDWYADEFGVPSTPPPDSGSSSGSGFLAGLGIVGVILGFFFRNIVIILIFVLLIVLVIGSDRRRYRSYYTYMGMPIPRYRPWYIFSSRPYRRWRAPPPPPGPNAPPAGRSSPPPRPPRSSASRPYSGPSSRPSSPPRSGRSGGSFGGRSGRSGGGGFHGGSGRSGGSFGGRR